MFWRVLLFDGLDVKFVSIVVKGILFVVDWLYFLVYGRIVDLREMIVGEVVIEMCVERLFLEFSKC